MENEITQFDLERQTYYDINTGFFTWRSCMGIEGGRSAERIHPDKYPCMTLNNVEYASDRLAWLYVTATLPDKVEHINGDIADNRWINLDVNNEKQQETNWRNKMKKENKKEKVREFKFVMNEYDDVIHVFIDIREKPIDSIHFMEHNDRGLDTMVEGWIPQNCDVANMLCRLSSTSDEIKDFYNERFDSICDIVCPDELLKEPIKVSGYYLDSVSKKISTKDNAMRDDRFGVVHKHDQIIGVVAFCYATHILARVNQGWEPDWTDTVAKWCIQSTKGEIVVNRVFFTSAFLAFETEKKAKLFLDEYKRLTANLSNAGII